MAKLLRILGAVLLVPGLMALCSALQVGPASWFTDEKSFWGMPICLFVFWIGLAHAGTLLSAVFLALGVRLDRRTALLAELSTLCSLSLAVVFPLVHLGVIENFYMVAPFVDSRGIFANAGSPLVWDFCCIAVYGLLSFLFFHNHLSSRNVPAQEIIRKPFAWLLLPLVLWVHSVVSLDFAATFVPEWQGAFFPVYFVVGAVYSGLALVNCLLCAEGYRVRLLEKLMIFSSWFIGVIWGWDFLTKGVFFTWAFVFAGLLPQLLWVGAVRESRVGRLLVGLSVLLGLFLERLYLVSPSMSELPSLGLVDLGLVSFSAGFFLLFYFGLRRFVGCFVDEGGTFFGDVDGSEMEEDLSATEPAEGDEEYVNPFSSREFKTIRLPLLLGILAMLLFTLWCLNVPDTDLTLVNMLPLTYPVLALVAGISLWVSSGVLREISRRVLLVVVMFCVLFGVLAGIFFVGYPSEESGRQIRSLSLTERENNSEKEKNTERDIGLSSSALLWNARCSSCHGSDGKLNEKFVREYYPVPNTLTLSRLDSLGEDSLYQVISRGRTNMNSYEGRLTEKEIRGLVRYMRFLAGEE